MGKNKLQRFAENQTFRCLVQPEFDEIFRRDHPLKGHWHDTFFGNNHPIVLELGCGRGEYTIALGTRFTARNFIGVDIKGARLWRGAKTATEHNMLNIGFLRTRIEFIDSLFAPNEVDELWITFPDPQLRKNRIKKRLTAPQFLEAYAHFLRPDGLIHLKTDSQHLHEYTKAVVEANGLECVECSNDIYGADTSDETLSIKTTYEQRFLDQGMRITHLSFRLGGRTSFVEADYPANAAL